MPSQDYIALANGAAALELALGEQQLEQLCRYAELVRHWNKTINLISRQDIDRLVSRHLLDCLSGHQWLQGRRVLDIGSGAGLPGIPLAIAQPHRQFVLCERSTKRVRFLDQVIRRLGLDTNVSAVAADAAELHQQFDTLVARAVSDAVRLWGEMHHLLVPHGRLVLFEQTQEDANTVEIEDGIDAKRFAVNIPGLMAQHSILVLQHQAEQASP